MSGISSRGLNSKPIISTPSKTKTAGDQPLSSQGFKISQSKPQVKTKWTSNTLDHDSDESGYHTDSSSTYSPTSATTTPISKPPSKLAWRSKTLELERERERNQQRPEPMPRKSLLGKDASPSVAPTPKPRAPKLETPKKPVSAHNIQWHSIARATSNKNLVAQNESSVPPESGPKSEILKKPVSAHNIQWHSIARATSNKNLVAQNESSAEDKIQKLDEELLNPEALKESLILHTEKWTAPSTNPNVKIPRKPAASHKEKIEKNLAPQKIYEENKRFAAAKDEIQKLIDARHEAAKNLPEESSEKTEHTKQAERYEALLKTLSQNRGGKLTAERKSIERKSREAKFRGARLIEKGLKLIEKEIEPIEKDIKIIQEQLKTHPKEVRTVRPKLTGLLEKLNTLMDEKSELLTRLHSDDTDEQL